MIRIGVIGVGNMGKNHVRLTREMTSLFALAGVYDMDAQRVRDTGYDGRIFSSAEELMEACDAVVLAVPSSLHKQYALLAAEKRVHCLAEKPLALCAADAQEIVRAFAGCGRVLMAGHVERFNPVVLELEKAVAKEKVVAVEIERCSPADMRISDTDVIYDLMIHDVDILLHALVPDADIRAQHSFGRTVYNERNVDFAQTLFSFENGVIACVTGSRTTEEKVRSIRIHCEKSYIVADLLQKSITIYRKTRYKLDIGYDSTYRQENVVEKVVVPNVEPLRNELNHFACCIETGCACKTDGASALRSLRVLDAIKREIYHAE